jgi:hypothetical protein
MQVANNLQAPNRARPFPEPAGSGGQVAAEANPQGWGWLPALSMVAALGTLVLSFANYGARRDAPWSDTMFWVAIIGMTVPLAIRMILSDVSRRERIGLVTVAGLAFYLVKVLHSPVAFTYFDENSHWRAVIDILAQRHLFQGNPLLPITAFFPGLESITAALVSVSGLSIFEAGIIVMGVGRIVFVLSLFLFYETIGNSTRLAALATFLYMTNPNFVFFDSQFAYESLSLPMAALVLYVVARRAQLATAASRGTMLLLLAGLATVVVTHHVTSYALLAFLVLWVIVGWSRSPGGCTSRRSRLAICPRTCATAWTS